MIVSDIYIEETLTLEHVMNRYCFFVDKWMSKLGLRLQLFTRLVTLMTQDG